MISSQFGFSPSVFSSTSAQTDFAYSQISQDSYSNDQSASFSHYFNSQLSSSDSSSSDNQTDPSSSSQIRRHEHDHDHDHEDDHTTDSNSDSAATAQTQAPAQPAQPPMLAALLGLPQAKPGTSAEGADKLTEDDKNAETAATTQTAANTATAGASGNKSTSQAQQAQTVADPFAAVKGAKTDASKQTQAKAPTTNRPMLTVPGQFQQWSADLSDQEGGASGAGTAGQAGINGALAGAGNAASQASGQVNANANSAAASAPIAFEMLVNGDSSTDAGASAEQLLTAPQMSAISNEVQQALTGSASTGAGLSAEANSATATHEADGQSNALSFASSVQEAKNNDSRSEAAEEAAPVKGANLDGAEEGSNKPEVKNLRVQLEGENNQRIDVRLSEQAGGLKVSVRTADANLTQALQSHMPQLTSRLEQQNYTTQVWMPRAAESSSSNNSNNSNAQQQFNSQNSDSSSQDQSGRRQNGRQNNQPDWLEDELPSQPRNYKETNIQI